MFDLINLIPAEELVPASQQPAQQSKFNTLARKSVTSFALEVHASCLTGSSPNGVIGAWGSVQYLKHVGPTHRHMAGAQKNRLGNPLINELFIGLTEKASKARIRFAVVLTCGGRRTTGTTSTRARRATFYR